MGFKSVEARREYHRKYYGNRIEVLKGMRGTKCEFCGWNAEPRVLEFAHKIGVIKEFEITSGKNKAWNNILKEFDNCFLLCPTCHRIYDLRR